MEQEDVIVPGLRDVRGTLDTPAAGTGVAVVACPPHPKFGGNRRDTRLRAVGEALVERGIATLRFDYGAWDGGRGERTDIDSALRWAHRRYDRVGLFGYSFGAANAMEVAAGRDDVGAISALAPGARAADVVDDIACPLQVVYGSRDDTVDSAPVVERARARGEAGHHVDVVEIPADHHFVGQGAKVARVVSEFLAAHLDGPAADG